MVSFARINNELNYYRQCAPDQINYDDIVFYLVNVSRAQAISPSHFPIIINYRIDCIMHALFYFKSTIIYGYTISAVTKIETLALFLRRYISIAGTKRRICEFLSCDASRTLFFFFFLNGIEFKSHILKMV